MTYPFAYYMKFTPTQKDLFECQQGMLWQLLDQLDEFTDDCNDSNIFFNKIINNIGNGNKFHSFFK